jgi:putative ABC transport system substrate-binding protein
MNRRRALLITASALLAAPLVAGAQQKPRLPRIGFLALGAASEDLRYMQAFRDELRALGHAEGRTLHIDYRTAKGDAKRMPALAAELVHELKADVVVIGSCGRLYMEAVRSASTTVPLVVAVCGDLPGFMGEVATLAKPGGNTTGMTIFAPELSAKRIGLLKELLPNLSTIWVLWNPDSAGWEPYWQELHRARKSLRVALQPVEVRSVEDIETGLLKIVPGDDAAILTLTDPILWLHRERIVGLAMERRLAGAYDFPELAEAGGLLAYGPNLLALIRRAASYADRILKGARPGALPVERPNKLDFVVNLKTARAIGLPIPQSLLLRADRVVE